MRVRFGPFAFDRQSRLLWRDGTEVALPPRVLGVLELLIDRAGQVVARQDLLDGVWKDAFVTDTSLAEAVSFLRQALGDDPQAPRYIQTVHRRGYRFLAPLTAEPVPAGAGWGLTPEMHFAGASGARAPFATSEAAEVSRVWQFLPLVVAVVSAIGLVAAVIWGRDRLAAGDAPPVARFAIASGAATFDREAPALAVSPDGRVLAWTACDADGACALYRRPIDQLESTRLAGSEDALQPFFSPDGRWIGFFAGGKLKKISTGGGSAVILADATSPGGASWGPNGQIVFAGSPGGGLSLVGDEGGPLSTLTTPKVGRGEIRHRFPAWLPSGGIVFSIATTPLADAPGVLAGIPAQGHDWTTMRGGVTRTVVAAPGYLLLAAGGDLQAATFNERSMTLTGGSESIIGTIAGAPVRDFATAGGTLVATPIGSAPSPTWSDGADATPLARMTSIVFSPDSRRAAGVVADAAGSDIWTVDLTSGASTRLTFGGMNVSPAWTADGSRVVFATRGAGPYTLASRSVTDRAVVAMQTDAPSHLFPGSVGPDGRIAVTAMTTSGRSAVGTIPPTGGRLTMLPAVPFDESNPAFSPDGRWLAIETCESGRTEIAAIEMSSGHRSAVTATGGTRPRWSTDGRTLFFDRRDELMRVAFNPADGSAGRPERVSTSPGLRALAITPSGRMLLPGNPTLDRAIVVLQWLQELRRRLPIPTNTPR
jgi:serine/threonine-protein kinase